MKSDIYCSVISRFLLSFCLRLGQCCLGLMYGICHTCLLPPCLMNYTSPPGCETWTLCDCFVTVMTRKKGSYLVTCLLVLLEVYFHSRVIKPLNCFQAWGLTDFSSKRAWDRTSMYFNLILILELGEILSLPGLSCQDYLCESVSLGALFVSFNSNGVLDGAQESAWQFTHTSPKCSRESIAQLLWGHGNLTPGCLKKITIYGSSAR